VGEIERGYRIFMRKPEAKNHSENIRINCKILLKWISDVETWKIEDSIYVI